MSTQIQRRGGTTAQTALFTGAQREITIDTTKNVVVVHDGATPGGHPMLSAANANLLGKLVATAHCFTKTAAGNISVLAGTSVNVQGTFLQFAVNTPVVMPTLTGGTDYAVYACTDGTVRADSSFTAPSGYSTANSQIIGGFHYGLVPAGTTATIANGFNTTASTVLTGTTVNLSTTVTMASTAGLALGMNVSGAGIAASTYISAIVANTSITLSVAATASASPSLTFTNTGMVWTQPSVDAIAGINKYSLWDLKFRPLCSPLGMVLTGNQVWVDIYLCNTNPTTNGSTSKAGTNIASGTVLPVIPAQFNGNGSTTYGVMDWWTANELARANGKRLPWESEFVDFAFGTLENTPVDNTGSTYPTTTHNAGFTSQYGIEQVAGVEWIWGQDSNFYSEVASPVGSYKDINGNSGAAGSGRGEVYTFGTYGLTRVILGGSRANGASGSRASIWLNNPWVSFWYVGLRAACDHMISV